MDLTKILQWLSSLDEMRSIPLTFFVCIAVGIAARLMPGLNNQLIPAIVVFSGPVTLLSLTDFNSSSAVSVRVFIFRTTFIGFIIGTTSWLVYHYGIRGLKRKYFGPNGDFDSTPSALTNKQIADKESKTDETKTSLPSPPTGV